MRTIVDQHIASWRTPIISALVWAFVGGCAGIGLLAGAEIWGVALISVSVVGAFIAYRRFGIRASWIAWFIGSAIPGIGLSALSLVSTCTSHAQNIEFKPNKPMASCDEIVASHMSMGVLFLSIAIIALLAPAAIARKIDAQQSAS